MPGGGASYSPSWLGHDRLVSDLVGVAISSFGRDRPGLILNVLYNHTWHYAETWQEMSELISDVMESLPSESREPIYHPGGDAWFMFSDKRHDNDTSMPENYLRIAINASTGYGGLIWCVAESDPRKGGIYDYVWVSDNPDPPDFDPRVVSDPGYPLFHDPRSTLPVAQVRAVIEEFCRVGTGDRPECIHWTRGQLNGWRTTEN